MTTKKTKPNPEKSDNEGQNMELWNQVCVTPGEHTKPIPGAGNLTSIDAYYLVRRCTELWGPMGGNWSFSPHLQILDTTHMDAPVQLVVCQGVIICPVGTVSSVSTCPLQFTDGKRLGKLDDDAYKKAYTNCLCKGLSYLGFGADVYMGVHADDKYQNKGGGDW